mmetsp:Transcript_12394/g.23230  ORF Transcript_12394/g.23230 Transcript_12394/m.23230 type:complete len:404 (+) Transcript_12394:74-1285(+)
MNARGNIEARPEWDRILSAAQKNNAQEIHNLINNQKVSPSHSNAVGQSALHIACLWGNKEAVHVLLIHGADVKAQNRITGATPLHSCVQSSKVPPMNRVDCAKLLFEYGADAYMKDFYDMTPLDALNAEIERCHGELEGDYIDNMSQVLEEGGKKDLKMIPLVENHDLEGLVDSFRNNHGDSSDEGTNLDVDERDPRNGRTALWIAIDQLTKGEIQSMDQVSTLFKIITLLLEKGANPNAIPDKELSLSKSSTTQMLESLSPIYVVCKALDRELVQYDDTDDYLAEQKIDALKNIASLLKSCGATITPCLSILHDAARRGHEGIIEYFVKVLGIDPNTKGRQGLSPLHFAARSGKVNVVKLLLSFESIDPMIVDDRGKTPLDAAMANEKDVIVDLLNAHMELL